MKGNNLKQIRESKGISQLDLSYKTRIAPADISRIENERLYCHPGWRKRISETLGVPEEKIFLKD